MLAATGDYRLFMDADNSTNIEQVEGMLARLEAGADIVIGSRRTAGAQITVPQGLHRSLAGQLGNLVIRSLALSTLRDTQAGFKLFTARAAEVVFTRLRIDRWAFDVEALAIAGRHGLRVVEAPIRWVDSGSSKVDAAAYVGILRDVLRIRLNLWTGRYG